MRGNDDPVQTSLANAIGEGLQAIVVGHDGGGHEVGNPVIFIFSALEISTWGRGKDTSLAVSRIDSIPGD